MVFSPFSQGGEQLGEHDDLPVEVGFAVQLDQSMPLETSMLTRPDWR